MNLSTQFIQTYLFVLGLGLLLYFVLRKTFIFSYARDKSNGRISRLIYTTWILFLIVAWIISIMIVVIHIVYGYFVTFTCFLFFAATLCIMIYFIYQGIKHNRLEKARAEATANSESETGSEEAVSK